MNDEMRGLLAVVATEIHRMARALPRLDGIAQATSLRFAVRKLQRELSIAGVEFIDLTGTPYDAGLAVDIVDRVGPADADEFEIQAMNAPLVMWQGHVLCRAEVTLMGLPKRGGGPFSPGIDWQRLLSTKRNRRRAARRRQRQNAIARTPQTLSSNRSKP
jgi:hypothetical protein